MKRAFLERCVLGLALALLLLWTPVWNGYPLIHSDSGTYIWSSAVFWVPTDRPIGYGLFMRAAALTASLWLVVLLQALGTAYLVLRVAELYMPRRAARLWLAFGVCVVTVLITTISGITGFILPDILGVWLFLGTVLFFVSNRTFDRVVAALALIAGVWSHNSHVILALGLAVPVAIGALWLRKREPVLFRRGLAWLAVVIVSLVSMFGINVYLHAGAELTRGGNTIWLNRFAEMGVLRQTLEQNCATKTWRMCAALESVSAHSGEFRWFLYGDESPIRQVGWNNGADEQREIVESALACCWQTILQESLRASGKQLALLQIQPYITSLDGSMNAVYAVRANYPSELAAFQNSRQQRGELVPVLLVPLDEVAAELAFFLVALLTLFVAVRRRQWDIALLVTGVLFFLGLNAIVMATFSGARPRYQGRMYWLLPYAAMVGAVALAARMRPSESPLFRRE